MLYAVVTQADFEEEEVLLKMAEFVIDFLRRRFGQPKSVMILCELVTDFEMYRGLAL